MSIKAVSWALDLYIPDMAAKLVLVALADHADAKSGECYPTVETLSKSASTSARTVQRKIALLTEWGFVEKLENFVNGRQRANSYRLVFDAKPLPQDVDEGCQPDAPARGDTVVRGEGDTAVTPEGDTAVTPLKRTVIGTVINNSADEPRNGVGVPDFDDLIFAYRPCDPNDRPHSARAEWGKMSDADKIKAVEDAPAFCKGAQGGDFIPYLVLYLRDRKWLSAVPGRPVPVEYVYPNTPRWAEVRRLTGKTDTSMFLCRGPDGRECFAYYPQTSAKRPSTQSATQGAAA